ncbi:hypothetical protein HCG94_13065, partial [Enterococcus faecium]|nr:hypothetical protein [Enterococcus faecium]
IVIPPAIFFYYSTLFDSRFKTLQQNHLTGITDEDMHDKKVHDVYQLVSTEIINRIEEFENE